MADALDILEVDRMDGPELTKDFFLGPTVNQRKSSGRAPAAKRPEGMSREVFALIQHEATVGAPLSSTDFGLGYQRTKARLGLKKVRPWTWTPFVNPGRSDDATLYHWRRVGDETRYPFAKFAKKLVVDSFTEEEYYDYIHDVDSGWSYEETAHLFELCQRFDVRFFLVHDRFDRVRFPSRTLEAVKERYYEVVNILHSVRNSGINSVPLKKLMPDTSSAPSGVLDDSQNPTEVSNQCGASETMMFRDYGVGFVFDSETEFRRKYQLNSLLSRSQEEIDEETALATEMKKLLARKREQKKKTKESSTAGRDDKSSVKRKSASSGSTRRTSESAVSTPSKEPEAAVPKFKLRFPEPTRCYSALSRTRPPSSDSAEARRIKTQLGQIDHCLGEMGVPVLVFGSDELCNKYNKLRSSFADLYEAKCEVDAARIELNNLADTYERLKPEGADDLGIPAHILNPASPDIDGADPLLHILLSELGGMGPGGRGDGAEAGRSQRSASELAQLDASAAAPTRKRKAALEQSNVLKKLKSRP